MGETKACRTCKVPKLLTEFAYRQSHQRRYRNNQCRACHRAYDREKSRRRYAALARQREELRRPIPPPDPRLDLQVIAACWADCVAEGAPATRRMVERIARVCWALPIPKAGSLSAAAIGYCEGWNDLAMVQTALEACVGLAVAS